MLLSHKTTVRLTDEESNIVGHMCYAAYKLWNICNYERRNYKELGLVKYPDWYYQKSVHKDEIWFKSLPSQTAQEVCKLLDKAWKSFYELKKTGGIENPRPPRFKQDKISITYMQNGLVHQIGSSRVRLTLSKQLKEHMNLNYGIHAEYLFLENDIFRNMDQIKQIKIYPPKEDGSCELITVYEIKDPEMLSDNGHYLSIDLGLHNLMTCYDSSGAGFIIGRQYLSIMQKFDKEIARVQEQWGKCQASKGIKYPKPSKHVLKLYEKKRNSVNDYLHKVTKYIADYCISEEIHTVIIGDIKGIRKGKNLGKVTNQKLHSLPYKKLYKQLEYKLKLSGISLIRQEESYTSQCSPRSETVARENACKKNRVHRGLYIEDGTIYNADAVGAYNIMRKYFAVSGISMKLPLSGLFSCKIIKVAV